MTSHEKVIIYIRLLDEGVPVARPTQAEIIGENLFRVLATEKYDPEDEVWEFIPGTIVRCEKRSGDGKEALLAVQKLDINLYG
jgi:hypothetical protein